MIYDTTVVTSCDRKTFEVFLNQKIASYANDGLEVELQFSTCGTSGVFSHQFSALVIARKPK